MNEGCMKESVPHTMLRTLRKLYSYVKADDCSNIDTIYNADEANDIIYEKLALDKPCMIARFGNELNTMINAMGVSCGRHDYWGYITGNTFQWWWNPKGVDLLTNCAGFFPPSHDALLKFGEMMQEDAKELDVLGSCWRAEARVQNLLEPVTKIKLVFLEPWHSIRPWSRILKGKKILVIHPFSDSIASQYEKRELLFDNKDILPEFESLRIIKAVQSIGGGNDNFKDWFEALDFMKAEMDKEPYDIALIGCGAYGFPLAAHAKRTGHKGVHLGELCNCFLELLATVG